MSELTKRQYKIVETFYSHIHMDGHRLKNMRMNKILHDQVPKLMDLKLEKKRKEGRGGWFEESECSIEKLKSLLIEHVEKGDMIDVMNIAAMIKVRELVDENQRPVCESCGQVFDEDSGEWLEAEPHHSEFWCNGCVQS